MSETGVRGYARHRGCAPSSVVKAIQTGRLDQAVSLDARGRPRINIALADQQWAQSTDPIMQRPIGGYPTLAEFSCGPSFELSIDSPRGLLAGLVAILEELEHHLGECLHQAAEAMPHAPAVHWQRLYDRWAELPDVLERLYERLKCMREDSGGS